MRAWFDGTADPLDNSVDLGPGNNFAEWMPGPAPSPEQLLICCEEQDQAEGCACGAHLEEHYRRISQLNAITGETPQ